MGAFLFCVRRIYVSDPYVLQQTTVKVVQAGFMPFRRRSLSPLEAYVCGAAISFNSQPYSYIAVQAVFMSFEGVPFLRDVCMWRPYMIRFNLQLYIYIARVVRAVFMSFGGVPFLRLRRMCGGPVHFSNQKYS